MCFFFFLPAPRPCFAVRAARVLRYFRNRGFRSAREKKNVRFIYLFVFRFFHPVIVNRAESTRVVGRSGDGSGRRRVAVGIEKRSKKNPGCGPDRKKVEKKIPSRVRDRYRLKKSYPVCRRDRCMNTYLSNKNKYTVVLRFYYGFKNETID